MARFFLNVRMADGALIQDREGCELVQLGRLHETMARIAAALIEDDLSAAGWTFEVVDELSRVVLSERLGALGTVGREEALPT